LSREYGELKEKEKGLKKALKMREEECEDLKKEVARTKEKNQAILDSMKLEVGRVREELGKTKHELEKEIGKNEELMESNAEVGMELARLKMTHQLGEEKYEKLVGSAQEKYGQFEKIIKEHEGVIELLEEKIRSQKGNEKEYFNKLQKCDYEINVVADKNDKISKEARTLDERNRMLENALKAKQAELADALRKLAEVESRLQEGEDVAGGLREQLQVGRNELEKSKKIIDILQKDYERAKNDIIAYTQKLTDRERECE
jgi:chromosome segregation ATPase